MWFIVARSRRSPAGGIWQPKAITGGPRTASPPCDDEPHRHFGGSLPRTARNRPHGSGSVQVGISSCQSGSIYPCRDNAVALDPRVQTQSGHVRGSRQNGSAQGGRAQEYVDISSPADAAMGHSGRTPAGRPDGFDLGQTGPCKGNQPSQRAASPDIFAIWTPRTCPDGVWILDPNPSPPFLQRCPY